MRNSIDYTMFVRDENNNLVLDRTGKFKDKNRNFEKPVVKKTWNIEERDTLVKAVMNSKTGSFNEVNKSFTESGFSGLRPVHVSIVKRYIKYGVVDRYLAGKSFIEKK